MTNPRPATPGHALRLIVGVVFLALAASCSAAPSVSLLETADPVSTNKQVLPGGAGPAAPAASPEEADLSETAPETLAFADPTVDPEPSAEFCEASTNIWVHSAALNLLSADGTPEMTQIALANVAEWLERSTFYADENSVSSRIAMFDAFTALTETLDDGVNWHTFQSSTAYANDEHAQRYENERDELTSFLHTECANTSMIDLQRAAKDRTAELLADFADEPSKVVESDALPGHAIFTHSSGRLIVSFPSAWSHEEYRADLDDRVLVAFAASADLEKFEDAQAIDGVRVLLVEATTLDDFKTLLAGTQTGTNCESQVALEERGVSRVQLTETFICDDHGATVIGQFNEERSVGMILEASFEQLEASRGDLIRLASIANSVLFS